jgi:tetratricopeptide (TPR) repeat protein
MKPVRTRIFLSILPLLLCASAPMQPPAQLVATDILGTVRINQDVSKALLEGVADYNARNYQAALRDVAIARGQGNRTVYDDFRINKFELALAEATGDWGSATSSTEAMAGSPALAPTDRWLVQSTALSLYASQKRLWRAIQFGEILDREGLLDAGSSVTLAQAYLDYGSYADAERVAQAALAKGAASADQSKDLSEIVRRSQVKEGARAPSLGEGLFGALLSSATNALTGQVSGAVGGIGAQAGVGGSIFNNAVANASGSAGSKFSDMAANKLGIGFGSGSPQGRQAAEQQAQQFAAREVLAADAMSGRAVYKDLLDSSAQLSKKDKKIAERNFEDAFALWKAQNYPGAQSGFREGLAIDPGNALANYYYADCLARGQNNSLVVIDYLARAVTFDPTGSDGGMARQALQGIATPQQSAGQN